MADDEEKSERLSDIIFERSRENELTFETHFGGFLFALVSVTSPSGIQVGIILLADGLLCGMSIIRWQSYKGRFANDEVFLQRTIRPVDLCAIICVVHLATVIAGFLPEVSFFTSIETTAALTIVAYLG